LRRRRLLLAAPLLLGGCAFLKNLFGRRKPPPPPAPEVRYVVGPPYQADGVWRYPREQFDYDETGLAIAIGAHGPFTTDGARYDPTALIAAHRTLQLPCVARVTNLETGLQVAVRIDDRGPEQPSRLLALSPRAITLLGAGSTPGVWRVRVEVLEAESRALADSVSGSQLPPLAAPERR
jgi:rare lipoprotein A